MNCKACNKEIVFLRTAQGKTMPVDAETADRADEYFDPERHVTHFRTCTTPSAFRRKK